MTELKDIYDTLAIVLAKRRKDRRNLNRLEAAVAGGWKIEFEPHQHFGLQTSTRGERRRAQLGRA